MLTCLRLRNANVPNESSFQGLLKTCNLSVLSIPETEKNALKRPKQLSESYSENTVVSLFIHFSAFFEPVSAALLVLVTAVIATVWLLL